MTVIYILLGVTLVSGIAIAIYEWRKKRTLLQHDMSLQPQHRTETQMATIQAQDATQHRISGFDR